MKESLEVEILSEEALLGKPGGRAELLGTTKDMLISVLEMGDCFHRASFLGNMKGHIGYLLGNIDGIRFPGFLEGKMKHN